VPLELPAQTIVAAATVVAALIAGLISFVNLTLTKELKTSEFRQAWIDALRDDLASFFSAARACARAFEARRALGESYEKTGFQFGDEQIAELRHNAAQTHYKIRLRLNPDEPDHIELLRLIACAIEQQNKYLRTGGTSEDTFLAIERAVEFARPVLKKEWKRVKAGETPFQVVRNCVTPAIVIVCIAFVGFLVGGKFKV
jgi:hypothetical protein